MNARCTSLYAGTYFILAVLVLSLFQPHTARADSRQEAIFEVARLHQTGVALKMPEETRSVEGTLSLADQHLQAGEMEQAERFYLLTIQKSRVLLSQLPEADQQPRPLPEPSLEASPHVTLHPPDSVPAPAETPPPPSVPAFEYPPASSGVVEALPTPQTVTGGIPPEPEYLPDEIVSEKLVGAPSVYQVVKGDTIRMIAAKLGVSRKHIIRQNNLDEKAYLKIGQKLVYNNRKIVPQRMKNGIVVNIPDRTLYYFKQGKLAISLPVALGVPVKSDKYDWTTPTGKFRITAKMKDPTWHVPPSIQSEMEEQGKEIVASVPPGPANPLGKFAFKTTLPGILIHSTTKPWSIYSFASHGCIRVYPDQMEEFFKEVAVNTPGEIIYKPVKLAVTEQGRVFLEVHQDVYGKSSGLEQEVRRLIEKQKLAGQVDWQKVEAIVRRKAGIAEDISL